MPVFPGFLEIIRVVHIKPKGSAPEYPHQKFWCYRI